MKKKTNTKTLDQFKDVHYGKHGTKKREKLEEGYKTIFLEEYNKKMDKIIAKKLPIDEKLWKLLNEASKYKIKQKTVKIPKK